MKNSEFYTTDEERNDAFFSCLNRMSLQNQILALKMSNGWLDSEAKGVHKVYNGTKIRIFGWTLPVVIDLTGCRTLDGNQCDLLTTSDDNECAKNLGKCRVVIGTDGIYAKTDRAKATGYSVGVEVENSERIDTGSRKINGKIIEAPFYHVTKSVLKEVMELPDENYVRISPKPDNVIELEKRVADLESENAELRKEKDFLLDELSKLAAASLSVINPFEKIEHLRDVTSKASLEINLRRVGFVQKP